MSVPEDTGQGVLPVAEFGVEDRWLIHSPVLQAPVAVRQATWNRGTAW